MNQKIFQWHSLKTRITLFTLAIFVAGIWSLAFYASRMLREDMQRLLGEQQFSTVSSIAAEINHEILDRIRILETVAGRVTPPMLANTATLQAFLDERLILREPFNNGIIFYDIDGTAVAEILHPAGRIGTNFMAVDAVAAALKEGKSTVSRPVSDERSQAPVFSITVPVRNALGHVIGALAGEISLGKPSFLDDMTKIRQGKNGYYLLEEPRGRLIITGTDKQRIMQPLPAPGVNALIDRHIDGHDETGITVNPLGVEVLASARRIPAAGWFAVAALPTAEAFAPIHEMQRRMLLAAIFLTLLAGVLIWWILRRQLSPMLDAARTLATLSEANESPPQLPIVRDDEIGDLIGGFNRLLNSLGQREMALIESEHRMRAILNTALDAVIGMSAEGRITDWNLRAEAIFGWSKDEALGQLLEDTIIPEQHKKAHRHGLARFLATNEERLLNRRIEITAQRRNGDEFPVELAITPLKTGDAYHFTAFIADISSRKKAEEKLHLAASVFSHAREGIVITTADGTIIEINDAFSRITGYSRDIVIGRNPRFLSSGRQEKEFYATMWRSLIEKGLWYGEIWNRRKNGEVYAELLTVSAVRNSDGITQHYVGLFSDITERKEMENQVRQLAFYDALTNLPNRRLLDDRLSQAMAASNRSDCYGALIFLDLDNFKPLNDTYGHAIGDLLLIEVADRLKNCVREMDTVARFGGDEFVVMLSELSVDEAESTTQAGVVAEKIRVALAEPYLLTVRHEGQTSSTVEHRCTTSIGVTLFVSQEASQDDILKWADSAMYDAKEAGRNMIRFHAPAHRTQD